MPRSRPGAFGCRELEFGNCRARLAKHALVVAAACFAAACRQDMHDTPRYEPLEASTFFTDGRSARTFVANTVARGTLREDEHLHQGTINGQLTDLFPMPVTDEMMARGRERFNVFCAPCHGRTGQGNGMVVQRGFRAPPSFHEERLRNAPVGYYVNVETNGFGAMSDYAAQVPAADRWAIAAYIRALQFSQRATVGEVPADRRGELDAAPPVPAGPPPPGQPGGQPGGQPVGQPAGQPAPEAR